MSHHNLKQGHDIIKGKGAMTPPNGYVIIVTSIKEFKKAKLGPLICLLLSLPLHCSLKGMDTIVSYLKLLIFEIGLVR